MPRQCEETPQISHEGIHRLITAQHSRHALLVRLSGSWLERFFQTFLDFVSILSIVLRHLTKHQRRLVVQQQRQVGHPGASALVPLVDLCNDFKLRPECLQVFSTSAERLQVGTQIHLHKHNVPQSTWHSELPGFGTTLWGNYPLTLYTNPHRLLAVSTLVEIHYCGN